MKDSNTFDSVKTAEEIAESIKKECEKQGLDYHETVNRIYIKSKTFSDWYIDLDTGEVYHENYRRYKGYHKHSFDGYSPQDIIRYIAVHDKKMLNRM